jgi:hypothetical protein
MTQPAEQTSRPQNPQNPYVFVVGCPRSGTTLLQRMLNSHPQLAVAYDTLFIPAVVRGQPEKNPAPTPALIDRIRCFERFQRFGLPDDILDDLAPGTEVYAELVSRIYDAFARLQRKPLAGEKSPGYVRHMPMLQELFPWARFVHLVRDGRNVALSLMDWGRQKKKPKGPAGKYRLWAESPVAVSALWWTYKVHQGRRDADRIRPGTYTEIAYESLVAQPETALRQVAAFLQLPYSTDMVHFYVGKTVHQEGMSAKSAWLPATPGIRDWRKSMQPDDLELFEALAGDCLAAFGYAPHFDTISPATRKRAERYRERWNLEHA